jgi:hypothetical protein
VRCVLALIFCGNRINEVTTATLGPLPLDQLPKSKPVTPYAVLLILPTSQDNTNPPQRAWDGKRPLRALAVADDAPAGA